MYSLQNISLSFNDRQILDGVGLHLSRGEVTALIGRNGSGKTTLLRIAAGELKPDTGSISHDGERPGYLPQEMENTVGTVGGFFSEYSVGEVHAALRQVDLQNTDWVQSVSTLSGGQKTKLGLAKVLLDNPTILLLDEPTNNLDLQGLEWLTNFVKNFHGAVLLTSHDRSFLDAVATRTVELKDGALKVYGGNYTFARTQQQYEREAYQAKYEAQESYKTRLEKDIANTKNQAIGVELSTTNDITRRYAKKVARKAVVREARLKREMSGTDWLEKQRSEDLVYLPLPETMVPASKIVVEVREVSKSFEGREVLSSLSFQLLGSQRVLISGPNGSGKTTLLSLILGGLEPDGGEVKIGAGIRVGSLSQDMSGLSLRSTGKTELLATKERPTRCFQYARALGLTVTDLEQEVGSLSRGQQTKLALTKVLLGSPQLLVLDEPTNHIELEAREAIEAALEEFEGAILVASHDRYFVETLDIDKEVLLESRIVEA